MIMTEAEKAALIVSLERRIKNAKRWLSFYVRQVDKELRQ